MNGSNSAQTHSQMPTRKRKVATAKNNSSSSASCVVADTTVSIIPTTITPAPSSFSVSSKIFPAVNINKNPKQSVVSALTQSLVHAPSPSSSQSQQHQPQRIFPPELILLIVEYFSFPHRFDPSSTSVLIVSPERRVTMGVSNTGSLVSGEKTFAEGADVELTIEFKQCTWRFGLIRCDEDDIQSIQLHQSGDLYTSAPSYGGSGVRVVSYDEQPGYPSGATALNNVVVTLRVDLQTNKVQFIVSGHDCGVFNEPIARLSEHRFRLHMFDQGTATIL